MSITIRCFSDRGGEYLSDAFLTFFDEQGTESKLAVHDTPEKNGVSERLNRTVNCRLDCRGVDALYLDEGVT
jgi:hypothetical protein